MIVLPNSRPCSTTATPPSSLAAIAAKQRRNYFALTSASRPQLTDEAFRTRFATKRERRAGFGVIGIFRPPRECAVLAALIKLSQCRSLYLDQSVDDDCCEVRSLLERDIPPSKAPFWHPCRLDENQMIPSASFVHHQSANADQSFDLYVKFEYLMLTRSINAYQEPRWLVEAYLPSIESRDISPD